MAAEEDGERPSVEKDIDTGSSTSSKENKKPTEVDSNRTLDAVASDDTEANNNYDDQAAIIESDASDPLEDIQSIQEDSNRSPSTVASDDPEEPEDPLTNTNHPCMWAISYQQLMDFNKDARKFFHRRGQWYRNKTMRDINHHIIIPKCQETEKPLAMQWNNEGLRIDAFITHCWDEPFADFVDSIQSVFHAKQKKPNLWICAFALRQDDPNEIEAQVETLDNCPFVRAIEHAEEFVVVRNATTDLYSRLWCVYELMHAKEFELIPDKIYVTGSDAFADRTGSCVHALAGNEADTKRIRDVLENRIEEIDELVQKYRKYESNPVVRRPRNHRGCFWVTLCIVLVLFVILLFVILGSLVIRHIKPPDIPTEPPKHEEPPSNENYFRGLLPEWVRSEIDFENYNSTVLGDELSCQTRAFNWSMKDPRFDEFRLNGDDFRNVQRFALACVYFATGGPTSWTSRDNWLSELDEHEWFKKTLFDSSDGGAGPGRPNGITHDQAKFLIDLMLANKAEHLLDLLLADNNLVGTIPPELFLISNLRSIDIARNALTGTIPSFVGYLTQLKFLSVMENKFISSLPTEIGKMTSLVSLVASWNPDLSGPIPTEIGYLTNLWQLALDKTGISGTIPTEVGEMNNIVALLFNNTRLQGSIPSTLGNVYNLQYIDISNNRLTGSIPSELGLMARTPSGSLIKTFLDIASEVTGQKFDKKVFENFFHHFEKGAVYGIEVANNFLSGAIPTELGQCSTFTLVSVSNNTLSGPIPTEMGQLSRLSELLLGGNQLTGHVPAQLCWMSLVQFDCSPALCGCDCACPNS